MDTWGMSFLWRISGLSLRDSVRTSIIWEAPGVELLPLHTKSSQRRWLSPIGEMFWACSTRRMSWGYPGSSGEIILGWKYLSVPLEKLEEVSGESDFWVSLIKLLPSWSGDLIRSIKWTDIGGLLSSQSWTDSESWDNQLSIMLVSFLLV